MTHRTTASFWAYYLRLPADVQQLADKNFELIKADPTHPSLQFKPVRGLWSARVGIHHRVLAIRQGSEVTWIWIGRHDEYVQRISGRVGN